MKKTPHEIHNNCPSVIMWKSIADGSIRPGLYCSKHFKWIKWISLKEVEIARSLGIEDMGLINHIKKPELPIHTSSKLKKLLSQLN